MAITGTGAIEGEQSILFIHINGIWYPIGEDNESLERTRNNTVTQTKNVLGATKSKVTKGNQVTSVSPFLIARDSSMVKELLISFGRASAPTAYMTVPRTPLPPRTASAL